MTTFETTFETMLDRILDWAETPMARKFDSSTFEGIKEYYDEHYDFTHFQEVAIENVYYKWKIDKWHSSLCGNGCDASDDDDESDDEAKEDAYMEEVKKLQKKYNIKTDKDGVIILPMGSAD